MDLSLNQMCFVGGFCLPFMNKLGSSFCLLKLGMMLLLLTLKSQQESNSSDISERTGLEKKGTLPSGRFYRTTHF